MKFNSFEIRMFKEAMKEATKSDYKHMHVGCVITYKHTIIGRGHNSNKTHPRQKNYNRKYREFNNNNGGYIHDSVHAEIDAINSISYTVGIQVDFSKAKVFVYRICPGKPLGYGNARPCGACVKAIDDMGIKDIYYTSDLGLSFLRLG